jgi:hypothetical protein
MHGHDVAVGKLALGSVQKLVKVTLEGIDDDGRQALLLHLQGKGPEKSGEFGVVDADATDILGHGGSFVNQVYDRVAEHALAVRG